jgi:hypothetical protein
VYVSSVCLCPLQSNTMNTRLRATLSCCDHSPRSKSLRGSCAHFACLQIRPELVKRIALRIVSAALAGSDPTSTACMTPAADAAGAHALSSPGQQRRLTLPEQVQQVQQVQQRPCSPGLALLQGRESMQEFSVSAFDHETAAYLIPVSHIGRCQPRGRDIAHHGTACQKQC